MVLRFPLYVIILRKHRSVLVATETTPCVCFRVLHERFGDSLTWPFRGAIQFQLLDQTGNNHKTHLCMYDDSVERSQSLTIIVCPYYY